ncbi:hypothetical protein OROGR_029260 [Orobanche gracilis]
MECSSEGSSVDRISMLPDELLGLILYHFVFKEQMAFSILSRRWRYLWTLTTSLDFDASCQNPTIEDFRIRFYMSKNDGGYINEWLRYALAKKVKTLVLDFKFTDRLLDMKFDECYVFPYRSLHIDEEIHFKQLKKLSLDHVRMDDESLKFLLHNCPLLEDLSISKSSKLSIMSVVGPFPSLKRLVISWCCDLKLLEIRDVNLVYLEYEGNYVQLRLHNLPKLVNRAVSKAMFDQMNEDVQFASILQQLEALYLHA